MARITGKDGIIKIDDVAVLQVRSWNLDTVGDVVEDSVIGTEARTYKPTLTGATGAMELYYDEEDLAAQILAGTEFAGELFPSGEVEGDTVYEFAAIVTGAPLSASFDGMTETSLSFQVTGPITQAVVPPA